MDTPAAPTDTPALSSPPSPLDIIKAMVGDLARPYAIVAGATSTAVATVIVALRATDLTGGGIFIGAAWGGVAALAGVRAMENVKVAQAQASTGPAPVAVKGSAE